MMPRRNDINTVMILGSGPIKIGQAAEFDFSGSQACRALREDGYEVILVNSNPATIQNDPEMARFLRPETLHGNKFESYLNEKEVKDITPTKPKYQTADERRNENNKQVFENTIKEIDNVHRTGTGTGNDETENIGAGFSSKETEGNSSFFKQLRS